MSIAKTLLFWTWMILPPNGMSLFMKSSKPSKEKSDALMRALAKAPRQ